MRVRRFVWLVVVVLLAANPASADFDIIARTGDNSPDGNGQFDLFATPAINNEQQVSFLSQLTGTDNGLLDNQAFYRNDQSGLETILRKGESFTGRDVVGFEPLVAYLDDDGYVAGVAALERPQPPGFFFQGFRGNGIFIGPHVPEGSASPSGNNSLDVLTATGYNYEGDLIYTGFYTGANEEAGLYRQLQGGPTTTLALFLGAAPRGGTFQNVGFGATLNRFGDVASFAAVDDGGDVESVLRVVGSNLQELVRNGDMTNDGNTTVESLLGSNAFIGNSRNVAFVAEYSQPSVLREGLFLAGNSGLDLIAPGLLPSGGSATVDMQVFGISDDDTVAFTTEFVGGVDRDSGIYVTDSNGPTLVAFEDTEVPNGDRYFQSFIPDTATFNDNGEMVFLAELSNTPNGSATGQGLYYYSVGTGLTTIIETGAMFDGDELSLLGFTGTLLAQSLQFADASLSGLNNLGQVAFAYTLDDGSNGVAVWTLPDPPGDYNDDGIVNLADYTVWRDNVGAPAGTLPNDPTGAAIGTEQYDIWKANFGEVGVASASIVAPVPEPSALGLALVACGFVRLRSTRGLRRGATICRGC